MTVAYPGRAEKGGGGINRSGVVGGDADSDENGVPMRKGNENDITKTTEVDVQYQDRNGPNDVDRMV